MNSIMLKAIALALALISTGAVAQTITVGDGNGLPGELVVVPVNFVTGGNQIGNFTVDIAYDATKFSAAEGDCSVMSISQLSQSCSGGGGAGIIRITGSRGTGELTTGLVANLNMTIANDAPVGPLALDGSMFAVGFNGMDIDLGDITVIDGTLTVNAGPQPTFSSAPPPGIINMGPFAEGSGTQTQNLTITNTGEAGSDLDGTCVFGAGDSEISLNTDGSFGPIAQGANEVEVIACDTTTGSAVAYTRALECTHDGDNPTANYTVNCTVELPPVPEYGSDPAPGATLNFGGTTEEGDPDPTDTVNITNVGGAGSFLDATCTESADPNNKFSISNGSFTGLAAGASNLVTVTCDASAEGLWTGQMSCTHTGDTVTDPALYDLSCNIGPPGLAVFASTPGPGSTINLTPGGAVPEGEVVPPLPLTFFNNADPGDSDLDILCSLTGSTEISMNPTTVLGVGGATIAPASSLPQTFSCDTTTAGVFQASLDCDYYLDGDVPPPTRGIDGTASYTIDCEVRLPETEVVPSPGDGATLETTVDIGGTGTVGTVRFEEVLDEDLMPNNASIDSCTIGGTDAGAFAISAPASFPQAIASGGFVDVVVEGTDINPGQQLYNGTMDCFYFDSNGDLPHDVSYQLVLNVEAGDATFRVTKEFTDGDNPTLVDVTLSCFTGLPLIQSQTISETQDVNFIVQSFESGELNCSVTEDLDTPELLGYTPTYVSGGPSSSDNDGGCNFYNVEGGDENTCHIINDADPVEVVIEKDWIIEGMGGDSVDQNFRVTVYCDAPILGQDVRGDFNGCGLIPIKGTDTDLLVLQYCKELYGFGDEIFVVDVIPEWPSSSCYAVETVYDSGVEIDNDCGNLQISHGQGDSCLITNTVFFEGIPTLSQYGMAILVLLMLGVGLVGFRRFA